MTYANVKSSPLNIRIKPQQRLLIEQAAEVSNKTVSDFVRDIALREANHVIFDRTVFHLDPVAWDTFKATLDAPPKNNVRLRELMARKPIWEK